MTLPKKIIYAALLFGILRALLLFLHNPNLIMNIDEESNYEVATNHYKGLGYTYYDSDKNGYFPTAFHGSFTIFVYENALLKNHIHKRKWVTFCNIISAILLSISIVYFYQLSCLFLPNTLAYYGTVLYCIFPSVIYYIGTLFWYEHIVLSMLIIAIYFIIKSLKSNLHTYEWTLVWVCVILSSLLRLQTLAIFVPLILFMIYSNIRNRKYKNFILYGGLLIAGFFSHIPSLIKNKAIYGEYILSTQFGYEILQGHNPHARGSWMGNWLLPSSLLYQFSHEKIPNIDHLNQYQEGIARKELALEWMKAHPIDELKLSMRKLGLYFLPRNFEFLPFNQFPNPLNLLVYAGFLFYLLGSLKLKFKDWDSARLILIMPFIGSMALTLVFFMGARWRFYAEPFMIIFALLLFKQITSKVNFLKNKFEGF